MKIVVEADLLAHDPQTGVYYYTQRLLAAAAKLDPSIAYQLVFFGSSRQFIERLGINGSNVTTKGIKWLPRKVYNALLRTPFRLPFDLVSGAQGDIFLFPRFVRWPLASKKPSIVIIYDTAYLDFPEVLKTNHYRRYLEFFVPRSIKKATQIVTISESTKRSLIDHYGTPAAKITVITPALDHAQFKPAPETEIEATKQKYGITKEYLLYLGAIEPRKNIGGIIDAYQALSPDLRDRYQLVVGGGTSWKDGELQLPQDAVVTGFVESGDITALYSGATLFVYPSHYEGWGMQILEAMACGTPVLTADNSSLPEVGGDAAVYAKTNDQASLNTELANLLSSPHSLDDLRTKGLQRAKSSNWEDSAQKLLALFTSISN
jgi:glycosyltransferase involved in cell wall biosynthesis